MSGYHSKHITQNFKRAIKSLTDNLQYLAEHDKVSDKFLSFQNQVIKHLITYFNKTEIIISSLEMDLDEMRLTKSQESQKLFDRIIAFEALCIIHGINDFPMWLARGQNSLVQEAIEMQKDGTIQLSAQFLEKIKNRPIEEQYEFQRLFDLEWERKVQKEIDDFKKKVNAIRAQRNKEREKDRRKRKETFTPGTQRILGFEI